MRLKNSNTNKVNMPIVVRNIGAAFALFALLFGAVGQAEAQKPFKTKAKFAILVDMNTNAVLFEKNADALMAPASMSKLMTLAVMFKALKDGQISMDDEFLVSENAWRTGGAPSGTSAMFAPLNANIALPDLIQGIVVQSGNDACIIVAEAMHGTEDAFAEVMTKQARAIGLKNSTFQNSTGLPHPDHLTTARDLAKLAAHLISEYPEHYPLFKQKEFPYRKHKFYTRNPLISQNIGVDGLKTGHTKDSGYGMVASADRSGRRLILVINGLASSKERRTEARRILDWGYSAFKKFTLFDENETVGEALVWGGAKRYVELIGEKKVSVWLPRSVARQVKASIIYNGPLKPPIKRGDQVARLRVVTSNKTTTEVPLFAAEDIERGPLWSRGVDSLLHLAFGWIL